MSSDSGLRYRRMRRLIETLPGKDRTTLSRIAALAMLVAVLSVAIACAGGAAAAPAGAQSPDTSDVTVPDNISNLDSDEVDRRLGRLLGSDPAGQGALAASGSPTEAKDPLLEEIRDLISSATPVPFTGEIVVSVSPRTLAGLGDPVLVIRSQPSHGVATVVSRNEISYVPRDARVKTDSFEYELLDGDVHVVSQIVEIRR